METAESWLFRCLLDEKSKHSDYLARPMSERRTIYEAFVRRLENTYSRRFAGVIESRRLLGVSSLYARLYEQRN